MHYRFVSQISDVDAGQWNTVAGRDYPFLRHEFLLALEASGSVNAARGWQPQHLLVEDGELLLAILPLYIKTHSYGEYVFDWSWAEAYQRHGLEYYPKLLSAIPFTPSTGPRTSTPVPCRRPRPRASSTQSMVRPSARRALARQLIFGPVFQAGHAHTLIAQVALALILFQLLHRDKLHITGDVRANAQVFVIARGVFVHHQPAEAREDVVAVAHIGG